MDKFGNMVKSILENKTHKILWGFEVQVDQLTSARKPNLQLINKEREREREREFVVLQNLPFRENKRKQKDKQILELCKRTKKAVEH